MKNSRWILSLVAVCAAAVQPANAQALKTWISGTGDDSYPCSRSAPCQSFSAALAMTMANGEIGVSDPLESGPVTINQSVRIDGSNAGTALIIGSGTDGITIAAGASDVVILRNLVLKGTGGAGTSRGIKFISGKVLIIENCDIYGFGQRAISIEPTNDAQVFIHNTNVHASQSNGIMVQPVGSAKVTMAMDDVRINDNVNYGLLVNGASSVTVRDSIISNHGVSGIRADATLGPVQLKLEHVTINGASIGIQTVSSAMVSLSNSDIVANGTGLSGIVYSYGNNRIYANTSGNGTPVAPVSLQ